MTGFPVTPRMPTTGLDGRHAQSAKQWLLAACLLALGCLGQLPGAWAGDVGDALKLRYFGTLGATRAASDRIQYTRDLSQPDGSSGGNWSGNPDSVVGMQANYAFSAQTEAVAQVVSRYRHDGTFRPELMWAYAHFTTDEGTELRLGRLGTDFYMLADSRLVGFSNLAIRPSPDFFGQLPLYHIDGADVSRTIPLGPGLVKAKLFAGYTGEKVPFISDSWDMGNSAMMGGNLDYHLDNWCVRLGYAQMRLKHDWPLSGMLAGMGVPAATIDALSMDNKTARYYSLGFMYDRGPFQAQWMLNKVWQESTGYQNYYSSYFLAGYRLDAFTPYLGVARSYSPPKQLHTGIPNIPALAPLNTYMGLVLNHSHTNQTTWTVGMRWDFQRNMDAKIQWDGIRGKSDSVFLYSGLAPGWSGSTDVVSLALDFAF